MLGVLKVTNIGYSMLGKATHSLHRSVSLWNSNSAAAITDDEQTLATFQRSDVAVSYWGENTDLPLYVTAPGYWLQDGRSGKDLTGSPAPLRFPKEASGFSETFAATGLSKCP